MPLQALAAGTSNMALWLHIPLAAHSSTKQSQSQPGHTEPGIGTSSSQHQQQHSGQSTTDNHTDTYHQDPWQWWNRVRCLCGHSSKLGLILEIPATLPTDLCLAHWAGEPVRAVMLSTKVFQANKRGYPALSRGHQAVIAAFYQMNVQVSSCLPFATVITSADGDAMPDM